jgi:hypothetical protein
MQIKTITYTLCLALLFSLTPTILAQGPGDLPEQAGIYDVPGQPKLKLRVFVHEPVRQSSPGRPAPSPTPPTANLCSLSDPGSNSVDSTTGWHLKDGPVTYRLNLSSVPSTVGSANLLTIVSNSFSEWSTKTNLSNHVSFAPGANTSTSRAASDGQNIIAWGRTSGSALAVTYTWYYPSTGEVAETDTIFNNKFSWAWSNQLACAYTGYYDAQDILTHELGHWMGLDDEYTSAYVDNTMYGYGSPTEVKKNTLTTGDITAINGLYY